MQAGGILIEGNEKLTEIGGFPILERVTGFQTKAWLLHTNWTYSAQFVIANNPLLKALPDFPKLKEVPELVISGNATLTHIGTYPLLERIGVSDRGYSIGLDISNNTTLLRLPELPRLIEVNTLRLRNNAILINAGEYPALKKIHVMLDVSNNSVITALPDLSNITTLNRLFVYENPLLLSLGGFPHLKTMSGSFSIGYNDSLTTLGDFSSLEQIHGDLELRNLKNLTSLTSLSSLRSIQQGNISGLSQVPNAELEAFQNQLDDPTVLTWR